TKPNLIPLPDEDRTAPNLELEQVNVDTIDRRRILSAIQQGRFPSRPTAPARAAEPPPETRPETSLADLVERAVTTSETQETMLTADERSALEEEARGMLSSTEDTIPPPAKPTGADTTRLRLSDPLVQDESLAEMARSKTPSAASADLFFRPPERGRPIIIPPVELLGVGEIPGAVIGGERQNLVQGLNWGSAPTVGESHVYARGRRRDDLFRYLENNLMEVNFSGKVFIKQGTIYTYSGNLTFWVKPQRQESVPPLVIVSGTGKLLLTDRHREITVLQIDQDEIFVEPSHLLACQETLTPRYAVIEKDGGKNAFHVLVIQGTGMLALSVATSPLVLSVQNAYPVNVSSGSIISWSGELTPTIVEDEALAELMLPGSPRGINLRLEGEGRVLMEKLIR
ncbi:MAG: AIM24 family protein, partial [Vicinamibacteria bacterium]